MAKKRSSAEVPLAAEASREWRWRLLVAGLAGIIIWFGNILTGITRPYQVATVRLAPAALAATSFSVEDNTLNYPALGLTAPLTILPNSNPFDVRDWSKIRPALTHGAAVSFVSNDFNIAPFAFVIGHSSDLYPHPYSAIFAGLNQAKIGDVITINIDHETYHYRVNAKKVLDPADAASFQALVSTDPTVHRLGIVTCWPVLTTRDRLVVVADRI